MTCNDRQYWIDRIAKVKALIEKYDDALLALGTGGVQSYQLDTGQTRQMVTKANITSLSNVRDSLLNELTTLQARVYGAGVRGIPNW